MDLRRFAFALLSVLVMAAGSSAARADDGTSPAAGAATEPPAAGSDETRSATAKEDTSFVDVRIDEPFEREYEETTRGLGDDGAPKTTPVDPRRGYATIAYKIGEKSNRDYLRRAIRAFVDTLPPKFGNSEGTYTVTLTVKDARGKELVREPILSFQWKKQSVFLVIENMIDKLMETQWSGTLINDLLVSEDTRQFKVGLVVYQSSSRAMDFESLKKTSKIYSEGALATFLPLPVAVTGVITAVGDIVELFYSGSKKDEWKESEEFQITEEAFTETVPVKFYDAEGKPWTLPIIFIVSSRPSRYMSGPFDAGKVSVTVAGEKTFTVVTAKDQQVKASLLELIRSSEAHPEARGLLDSVAAKRKLDGDFSAECGALYSAISNYLSVPDARSLFWAFLKQNETLLDTAACLSGGRKEELEQVGLKP